MEIRFAQSSNPTAIRAKVGAMLGLSNPDASSLLLVIVFAVLFDRDSSLKSWSN
jgi:hypothetical protein